MPWSWENPPIVEEKSIESKLSATALIGHSGALEQLESHHSSPPLGYRNT
jgi:hypothetical protein